ncbi:MAG TPA: VOC family protein [Polyangiaceae bacterium]|jgi:PhnB protein|nr:VOC family protein [Polyangiaceae bacterium]
MTIKSLNPSLAFNGTCARAIALYERALGAKIETLVHFGDAEKMGQSFDVASKDLVLHATLQLGGGKLMVMDAPPSRPVPSDTNVHVYVDFAAARELETSFAILAQGGTVTMPVADTFWGSRFGMLQDEFGIRWMLSHELQKT